MSTFWVVSIFEQCGGRFWPEKRKWEENLSLLSLKKRAIFLLFFRIFEGREADLLVGGPKNKTHRLLSLSHTFLLRKEPPSTTNDRFQSEWQIRIKALLPRMASNKRESVRFFTPPIIGLLLYVRERDKIYLIPLFRLFLSLSSSAPPPQPLSISRRRRAIPIAKEQTRKKSARARV